jgi:hypothetical protein
MRTEMPLSKPLRLLVSQAEDLLDTEISLLRNPEADPNGTLVDVYTYTVEKNFILLPAHYTGLLKDFVIARHCMHLLIKGAAAKKSRYLVCSFTGDSLYRGLHQIYLDALKDEAKKAEKLPVMKLIQMLSILYSNFNDDINELPWNPITNARIYHRMPSLRQTQLYYLLKEGKRDMDDMMEYENIIPRRYFVLNKSMFYARDLYLAKILPADQLMPVINIPQMKKFNHLEVKEMLTTRWTNTSWYQSKIFGDTMLEIMEKYLQKIDWNAEPSLDYFHHLYQTGVNMTNHFISYMSMDGWFVWEPAQHLQEAREKKTEYEYAALKKIFGDLIDRSSLDGKPG